MRLALLALPALLVAAQPADAQASAAAAEEARAKAVIVRSKTTRATYAVYTWTVLYPKGGKKIEEWSAEFNSGNLHRVEPPRDRLVANCARKTGAHLSLLDGTVKTDGNTANLGCGITYDESIRRIAWLGKHSGPWGEVDRVRLWGAGLIRTYDVTANGVIVSSTFADQESPERPLLEMRTVALEKSLPKGTLFTRSSLSRSAMPERFTRPPAP